MKHSFTERAYFARLNSKVVLWQIVAGDSTMFALRILFLIIFSHEKTLAAIGCDKGST
jgi:hypothetical protein